MRLLRLLVSSLLGPLLLLIPPCLGSDDELGGEKAVLDNHLFSYNISHRQSVCHRYLEWRDGKRELKDALSGLELRPLMAMGDFFSYSDENGINREEPGLMAELMDALGESANFTWRSSFGVMEQPEDLNKTWTELLLWGIETYDIAVNWWDQSVERMEAGAAYVEPWFDGSVILVDEEDPPVADDSIDLLNWLKPYETSVWCMILLTIVLSALAYQLIEHLTDERDDRPFLQWFSDNVYLSSLNFTQNFEYAPSHVAGRIFGVSMGVWALVITATYTANLASLFVEDQRPALVVDSIDQAIALGIPICTFKGTNADFIIKRRYENAIRVPMNTELQGYQALKRGECGLVAGYRDNWLGFEHNTKYNPDCDLNWVGRTVEIIKSGFAVKADAGYKCSSLIREVLNIHMTRLISEGKLEEVWEKHRSKTRDQNCDVESSDTGRRQLAAKSGLRGKREQSARKLKGGSSAAAASGGGGSSGPSRLTLKQMLGTFFLHWFSTFIAILVALGSKYYRKVFGLSMDVVTSVEKVMYRKHGPTVGSSPPLNTYRSARAMSSSARENSLDIGNLRYSDRSNSDRSNSSHSESRGRFLSLRRSTSVIEQHPITAIAEEGDRNDEQAEEVAALRGELQKTKKELDDKMDMVLLLLRKMQPTPTPAERDSDSPNLPDFAA